MAKLTVGLVWIAQSYRFKLTQNITAKQMQYQIMGIRGQFGYGIMVLATLYLLPCIMEEVKHNNGQKLKVFLLYGYQSEI
jgi:hypothetical protein